MKHLDLLNAVLALRFKQPGWPPVLADAGYLVHGVGVSFKLSGSETVTPDVLASCAARNATLLIEVKGGANFDHDQLGRMERVRATDLRDAAYLRIGDVGTHRIAVIVVCNVEQYDSFIDAARGRPATIVAFDGSRFVIGGAALPDPVLQGLWENVSIGPSTAALNIVPFDQESDLGTVARIVVPEMVALLINGAGAFNVDTILQKTHSTCHGVMQSTGSGAEVVGIRRRLVEVIQEASKNELASWFSKIPGQQMWTFNSAFPSDLSARTRELKALQKNALDLVERLGGGKGIQLDLLDYAFDDE